jgi:copper chaperone CopZ
MLFSRQSDAYLQNDQYYTPVLFKKLPTQYTIPTTDMKKYESILYKLIFEQKSSIRDALINLRSEYKNFTPMRIKHDINAIKKCISKNQPVIFNMKIFITNIEETDIHNVPKNRSITELPANHTMICIGFDDTTNTCLIGYDNNYTTTHYDYISHSDLCGDFWTLIGL